jgi:hypothetical protein
MLQTELLKAVGLEDVASEVETVQGGLIKG